MSEDDLGIWEGLLEQGLSSGSSSIGPGDVVDDIASRCPVIGPRYATGLLSFSLMLMTCSFPVSTALRIAIAFLKNLHLRERDSIPARTFSFLNATLVSSYPPQSSTSDAVSALLKAFHPIIMSTPVSLLKSVICAIQTGLAVWIEDERFSLQGEAYNDLVSDFLFPLSPYSLLSLLPSSCLSTNRSFSVCNCSHCL
jgi:hypothetical protein